MVSSLGYQLGKNSVVSGFGRRRVHRTTRGKGIVRNVASAATRALGNILVNRVANAIAGGSWKATGSGVHKRKHRNPRSTLSGCGRKRITTIRRPRIVLT